MIEPKIGDSSDKPISFASGKRIHGWSIEEWIEAIKRQPDRSLPNGVGGALVNFYEEKK